MAKDDKNSEQNITTLVEENDPGVTSTQEQGVFIPKTPIAINPNNPATQKAIQEEAGVYPRESKGMDPTSLPALLPKTITVQRGPGGSKWFYTGDKLVDEDDAHPAGQEPDITRGALAVPDLFMMIFSDAGMMVHK